MRLITLALMMFVSVAYAQLPKMEITKDGIKPIIVEVPNMSAESIYKKVYNWVQRNFENPNEVIKGNIEGEFLRINIFDKKGYEYKALGGIYRSGAEYTIEIDIKDNQYVFASKIENLLDAGGYVYKFKPKSYFKKNGQVKTRKEIEINSLKKMLNSRNSVIYKYIIN